MGNLAGSEKCYGNKSCIKRRGRCLVWYEESLEIMFQVPDDLSTITGLVVTSFGEKIRS